VKTALETLLQEQPLVQRTKMRCPRMLAQHLQQVVHGRSWAPKFANDKLLLAFDSVLGNTAGANGTNGGATGANNTTWWGASAYAKYQFNDWFSLCSRGEYFGGDNLNKISNDLGNNNQAAGLSWWEYTITAGFNVIDNVLIRAEYRLDWGDNISGTNTGANAGQLNSSGPAHYAGAEVVYSF
jgi:hypothetical protein